MSTLAQFGLWQKAQELLKPGSQTGQGGHNPGKAHDETRADTDSNRASQANRPFRQTIHVTRKNIRIRMNQMLPRMWLMMKPGLVGLPGLGTKKSVQNKRLQ